MVTIINGCDYPGSPEALYSIYKEQIYSYLTEEEFSDFCRIDHITSFDLDAGVITNRFGRTSIDKISTGLKTVLLANYYGKADINKVINSSECGPNALDILLHLGDKYNLTLYTIFPEPTSYKGSISYKGEVYSDWRDVVEVFEYVPL